MKIVIDKDIPFIHRVLERDADVVYLPGRDISRGDLADADAMIIRTRTRCDATLLKGTKVKFIASATIGFDHIDTAFCRENNIQWTNAEGCNSSSVQQYITAALFHLAKKLQFRLAGKTIGIVGVGNVGSKVAAVCSTLGMRVLLNDPPRERLEGSGTFVSLNTIVRESDIITFHVPLNREGVDKTFHMIDDKFLASLKKHQILINSSRGEIADTRALRMALKAKTFVASVLDVWENEPDIDLDLLGLVDIGTPHIAGYSADGKANGTAMSVRAISKFFGLGLDDWFPEEIPSPQDTVITVDCRDLESETVVGMLVRHTYDIMGDDRRLRNSPRTFEKQRADYPLRREFPTYAVRLLQPKNNFGSLIKKIGFKISFS